MPKEKGKSPGLVCWIDYLQHRLPWLHVCEDFDAVGDLGKRGRVVIGINNQDVDSYWAALLDAI